MALNGPLRLTGQGSFLPSAAEHQEFPFQAIITN